MSENSTSVTVYVKMKIFLQVEGSLNHLFLIVTNPFESRENKGCNIKTLNMFWKTTTHKPF